MPDCQYVRRHVSKPHDDSSILLPSVQKRKFSRHIASFSDKKTLNLKKPPCRGDKPTVCFRCAKTRLLLSPSPCSAPPGQAPASGGTTPNSNRVLRQRNHRPKEPHNGGLRQRGDGEGFFRADHQPEPTPTAASRAEAPPRPSSMPCSPISGASARRSLRNAGVRPQDQKTTPTASQRNALLRCDDLASNFESTWRSPVSCAGGRRPGGWRTSWNLSRQTRVVPRVSSSCCPSAGAPPPSFSSGSVNYVVDEWNRAKGETPEYQFESSLHPRPHDGQYLYRALGERPERIFCQGVPGIRLPQPAGEAHAFFCEIITTGTNV